MGLGFTLGLTLIGLFRELLGAGQIFGAQVLSLSWFTPITIFVMAPGAFLVLACLVAVMNIVRAKMEQKANHLQNHPDVSLVIVQDVECLQHVPVKNRNQQQTEKQSRRIDTDERINFNCSRICDCK